MIVLESVIRPHVRDTATPAVTEHLGALARYEVRRYVRYPLFALGLGLTALICTLDLRTTLTDPTDLPPAITVFLGVLGMAIGFRLTCMTQRADEVLDVTPASPQLRTAALCLTGLISFTAGVLAFAAILIFQHPAGAWTYGVFGLSDQFAILAGQVAICALGGPLLGIAVARWVRSVWALPALVVFVGAWVVFVSGVGATYPSPLAAVLVRMLSPCTFFVSLDKYPRQVESWRGSPWFFLGWQVCLCALAVTVALLRDAGPRWRRSLQLTLVAVGLAAVTMYLLAAIGGLHHPVATRPNGFVIPL